MDERMTYSHVGLQLNVKVRAILLLSVVGIEVCVAESVMSGAKHERPLNEHVDNVDRKPDRCRSFSFNQWVGLSSIAHMGGTCET